MRYSSPANWVSIEECRGLLFFAQRVEELTFSYSIPSYKSRAISIAGLIREAADCLKQANIRPNVIGQAEHIIEELKSRISRSPAARKTLRLPIEKYFNLDLSNPTEASNKLLSMRAELNRVSYVENIESMLIDELSGKFSKETVNELASELIDTVQYHGISREHINRCANELFFSSNPVNDIEIVSEFIKQIFPHVHDFRVFLLVDSNIKEIDNSLLSSFSISILEETPKNITKKDHGKFLSALKKNDHLCAAVDVESYDYFSAAEKAKDSIEILSDLYRVFHHKWNHELGSLAVVEQKCCAGIFKEVNMPGNFMHYVKDSRPQRAQEMLSEALNSVTFVNGPDRNRYLSLISMHGLSLQSSVSDSQLINIWTCLETIVPPKRNNGDVSNVDHVISSIMPIMMMSYLKNLILTLLFDLMRWDKTKVTSAFATYGEFNSADPTRKLLQIMTDKDRPDAIKKLLSDLDTFELLKYRLFRLTETFRDRDLLNKKLSSHKRNVSWQLYRIYRGRNKIVHAGESSQYNKYLVENAHQYYDDVFEFCISLSSNLREMSTFELCFTFANEHYNHYMNSLNSDKYLESCIWDLNKI